ncbi:MAG: YiiD C-terminal domain-containing protein [Arenimonas sp.]
MHALDAPLPPLADAPVDTDALAALDARFAAMPPAAAMQIRAARLDADGLRLHAPLGANVNDKGCAFGGSLASVLTLAAWGLVDARLRELGRPAEVYVADSHLKYLLPLYDDLQAHAWVAPGEDWDAFVRCLDERGKARLALQADVRDGAGRPVATLAARFAALRPTRA